MTAFKLLSLLGTEKKPTYFHLICNNRAWSSKLMFWPLFPFTTHLFLKGSTGRGLRINPSNSTGSLVRMRHSSRSLRTGEQKYHLCCCSLRDSYCILTPLHPAELHTGCISRLQPAWQSCYQSHSRTLAQRLYALIPKPSSEVLSLLAIMCKHIILLHKKSAVN